MSVGMFFALIGVIAVLLGLHAVALDASLAKVVPLFLIGIFWICWGFARSYNLIG